MPLLSQKTQETVKNTAKESLIILIFEMIGTFLMTTLISNFYSEIMLKNKRIEADICDLYLGMFVIIMFSARISGSHFNPCITFSFMVGNVKNAKFDRILGFLYIVAQIAGALIGGIFSSIFKSGEKEDKVPLYVSSDMMIE